MFAFPLGTWLQVVTDEHAWLGSWFEFRHGSDRLGLRQEVHGAAERHEETVKVPMPMASVPRRVSVDDSHVMHEAPVADREDPEAGRETRMFQQGPGSFDRIAYLSLAISIGLMSPWRSFAVRDTHVCQCSDQLWGRI